MNTGKGDESQSLRLCGFAASALHGGGNAAAMNAGDSAWVSELAALRLCGLSVPWVALRLQRSMAALRLQRSMAALQLCGFAASAFHGGFAALTLSRVRACTRSGDEHMRRRMSLRACGFAALRLERSMAVATQRRWTQKTAHESQSLRPWRLCGFAAWAFHGGFAASVAAWRLCGFAAWAFHGGFAALRLERSMAALRLQRSMAALRLQRSMAALQLCGFSVPWRLCGFDAFQGARVYPNPRAMKLVKLVKNDQLGQKFVKSSSSWSQMTNLVKSWSSWSKMTNLIKLFKS